MTLLELLVKTIGSWPAEAHGAVQDNSGQVWFFKNGKPEFSVSFWAADHKSKNFYWVESDRRLERSKDYSTSIVTREQYESAIAAQQPAWDGEGLPPVSSKCEYIGNDTSWGVVKVIGYDEGRVVFKPSGEDYYGITPGYKSVFRPLRTEADRKREEAINAISLAYDTQDRFGNYRAATGVYEDIAAGKIPGVELSK